MSFELFLGPAVAFVLGAKFTLHKIEEVDRANKEYYLQKIERIHTTIIANREYADHQLDKVRESTERTDTRLTTTNKRLNVIEEKMDETIPRMVTTLQPLTAALKEVQTFVGLRS